MNYSHSLPLSLYLLEVLSSVLHRWKEFQPNYSLLSAACDLCDCDRFLAVKRVCFCLIDARATHYVGECNTETVSSEVNN